MTTPCRHLALAAIAFVAISGCRGASGPKVKLRYHPAAGTSHHYALEQQNAVKFEGGPMVGLPEQSLTMRLYFTQAVGGPAAGGTAVTVTYDSTALESPGMGVGAMQPALDRMRGMQSDIVYDDRMQVVSAVFRSLAGSPSPLTEQMGKSVKGMAFPLPEGPVGVGDSWTSETELPLGEQLNASAPVKAKTRLTVKQIQAAGADTSVLLAIETTFPGDPVRVTQQGQQVMMQLSGELTGEQLYSLTQSTPTRATIGGTMHIKVKGGPAGQSEMAVVMRQRTSLQLTGAN